MDLVLCDGSFSDQKVMGGYTLDLAFGKDENDFQITVPINEDLPIGWYVYYAETEWGGIIDSREIDATGETPKRIYSGRTWHGMLSHSILCPDAGQDYLSYSGDLNAIIAAAIARLGLGSVFCAAEEPCGITASGNYERYIDAYSGLRKVCRSKGCRLKVSKRSQGLVELSAVPLETHELDSDQYTFSIKDDARPVNHLVCLGKGELRNRAVIHLFADTNGAISQTQTFFGAAHVGEVYDCSNSETDDLLEQGIDKLSEYQDSSSCELVLADGLRFEIDDIINATSVETGIQIITSIAKAIVTMLADGTFEVSYEVGTLTY